jgi:hypothetical protein
MAVQGAGNIPDRIRAVPPVKAQPAARKAPAPAAQPRDAVTLSPKAREAQNLSRQAEAAPEVRPQAVAQAKAQKPSAPAAKVAEKLLLEN